MSPSLPEPPAPAAIRLPARRTALLVLDLTDLACTRAPAAAATLPAVRTLLDRARTAGLRIVFSIGRAPQEVHSALARAADEPVVRSSADKFFRTDLEALLDGIRNVVICGTAANGAVLYTSFAACARGFTVVVPVDAISSRDTVATAVAAWQLLDQPGFRNPENTALLENAVTLSRTELIAFV